MRLNEIEVPKYYKYLAADYRLQLTQELVDMFKFVEQIKKNCQPYLKQVNYGAFGKLPLYRGMKNDEPALTKDVRLTNRKPTDTPLYMQQIIQGYFKKNYGEAFRSALFCSGSIGTASRYGSNIYRVFPIGDFTFLWSPEIDDLYSMLEEYNLENNNDVDEDLIQSFKDEVLATYTTEDMIAATLSHHEVMIRAKAYYAIREDYITIEHKKAYTELLKR